MFKRPTGDVSSPFPVGGTPSYPTSAQLAAIRHLSPGGAVGPNGATSTKTVISIPSIIPGRSVTEEASSSSQDSLSSGEEFHYPLPCPAPPLPLDHVFNPAPTRRILTPATDMKKWLGSEAFRRYLIFLQCLNFSVKNRPLQDPVHQSVMVGQLLVMLDQLNTWIDEIPPLTSPQRYGNTAFRTWLDRVEENAVPMLKQLLSQHTSYLEQKVEEAAHELAAYWIQSWGNGTRIDYGSGHEMFWMFFLACLAVMGLVESEDYPALVLRVFAKYLVVTRRLQTVYSLEPAGSHGVWGLDDYSFLPYYFGAAQLLDHPRLRPKAIMSRDIVDHFAPQYMYLDCIRFIHVMKQGPFHEHSPMLFDISGVPTWSKVNSGMLKMYVAEVLDKFPIVQHLVFGSLMPWSPCAVEKLGSTASSIVVEDRPIPPQPPASSE